MVQLEDGWPLGLRLMNARVGLAGNHHYLSALFSFNTLRTHSPSSFTDFSSDLDTELQCCLNRLPKREPEDQMENLFRMIYLSLSSFSDRVWVRQIEAFVLLQHSVCLLPS
ncbi:uncharacterized protein LOC111801130 isoform X2 [Cucurbita pepo subsp. pepo]|uniref:uncharacterized protein LOC111801130 isoform X2 n=1 Tax=Cucurbita pepo subsp. pepo TaxID=3664 RepID=UPI000C9D5FC0|nr:uncharacterized protein LOC111801130 isoform X2 [Cucurbita pepo subsp. pepo]